jgi:hypothetical protein
MTLSVLFAISCPKLALGLQCKYCSSESGILLLFAPLILHSIFCYLLVSIQKYIVIQNFTEFFSCRESRKVIQNSYTL